MTRYNITDRRSLELVGLPAYLIGTWDHYTTSPDGWVRLGRVSGKGQKFASFTAADWSKMLHHGLAVAA